MGDFGVALRTNTLHKASVERAAFLGHVREMKDAFLFIINDIVTYERRKQMHNFQMLPNGGEKLLQMVARTTNAAHMLEEQMSAYLSNFQFRIRTAQWEATCNYYLQSFSGDLQELSYKLSVSLRDLLIEVISDSIASTVVRRGGQYEIDVTPALRLGEYFEQRAGVLLQDAYTIYDVMRYTGELKQLVFQVLSMN